MLVGNSEWVHYVYVPYMYTKICLLDHVLLHVYYHLHDSLVPKREAGCPTDGMMTRDLVDRGNIPLVM